MKAKYLLFFALFSSLVLSAQDMQKGFSFLENGQFKQAEIFFEDILVEHPTNKTGLICYGRAVGLSGDPQKSVSIFNELLTNYPNDLEVLLNKAEAFLWKKDPSAAIAEYKNILTNDEGLFSALLGIANSYSMHGEYEKSFSYITKALKADPNNTQANVSAKYIRLGYANQLASEKQEHEQAINLVGINLKNDQDDQESLGLLANIFLITGQYESADSVYASMANPLDAIIGQSTSQHLLGNDKQALTLAQQAFNSPDDSANEVDRTRKNTHLVSALLWNNQIKDAGSLIDSLTAQSPSNPEVLASKAEVAMYEADFDLGIANYTAYLKIDSNSFKGNLGRADAFHALGLDGKSYNYAFQTLSLYPGQKDVLGFIGRLNTQHSPKLSTSYTVGKVSDGSSFDVWTVRGATSITPMISTSASLSEKNFQTDNEETGTKSKTMVLATSMRLNRSLKLQASYGFMKILQKEGPTQNRSDIDLSMQYRVNKVQNLTLAYQTEIQDFNAQLLNQNLKTTHLVIKNAMFWKVKGIGSYTELYKSFLSDGNSRALLFTSVYKSFNSPAQLKAGLNYLTMAFKKQIPESYFSPNTYNQLEVFTSWNYTGKKLPFTISVDLAGGLQSLEQQAQTTWRTKLVVGKSIGRLNLELAGSYSSISAAQTNGFSVSQLSGKAIWRISDTPLFFKSLKSN